MNSSNRFDVLIVVTPSDCERLMTLYPRLVDSFDYGDLCFVGAPLVGEIASSNKEIASRVKWVDENEIIPFDAVNECMKRRLQPLIGDEPFSRGITGWYYQQFLKMQYAFICKDEYYMVWDGDTVPCRKINMFSKETGQPYLDLKHEHHQEYFDTLGKILPGFRKVIERSFISEHMLFRCDIMRSLIADIEKNDNIPGKAFWEKIINAIEPEKIQDSSFSEFETYGTYVALRYPSVYKLRDWHSFRQGGSFFDMNTICDRDFEWLSKDFDAISFEKGHSVREDHKNFFDNPEYQEKLSAKKMLQLAQMEYKEGYKEVWADDIQASQNANVTSGSFYSGDENNDRTLIVIVSYNSMHLMQQNIKSIRDVLTPGTYRIVVVDNASDDGVCEWLKEQEDILLIKNKENVGFGPACNQGASVDAGEEFAGADIYLLNNDTRLVFDALYFLKEALYSSDDIGAVGSVSNYAGNKQQLDISFDTVEEYIKFGERNNVPIEMPCLERVRLSGFSMLIKRKVWDEVGGFDEDFAPGYFEDDALSMEILKRGYRLKLVRNSFVYHAGSQSFIKTDYTKLLSEHHSLFIRKYGFDILKYAYGSGTVVTQIPYGTNSVFNVLHYGCGLGADLKAIRTLFPKCNLVGIETDNKLFEIARRTEEVFNSVEELLAFYDPGYFNVLIIDSKLNQELDEEMCDVLSSLLAEGAVVINKNMEYEEFPYDKIKLIIWDMDDTFWSGILSEGEVELPDFNVRLIRQITDNGVVNSISSKNDKAPVMEELEKAGIADLFVFNNINWEEKGLQIASKLEAMGLRAENALFIDDNPRNLEEARFHSKELMVALPDIIPYLANYYGRKQPLDKEHKRLKQYRILEEKAKAQLKFESKEQFLFDSDIRITIDKNCMDEIDRIAELVGRSNQLNYTKNRDDKEMLARLVNDDWNDAAYIRCHDRFGDYGIVGFYCYNTRERKMEHFLFSCRALGMGIEQYIYEKLGFPDFEVKGPISVELKKEKLVKWITEEDEKEIPKENGNSRVRVLLKGPCDMDSIAPYIRGGSITTEFNYINEFGFVTTGQNHSMHIWESENLSKDEINSIIEEVPFIIEGDFKTKIFTEEYHVICYSLLQDMGSALYRNKKTGNFISFGSRNYDITRPELAEKLINSEIQNHGFGFTKEILDNFRKNWEYLGTTPWDMLLRNLDYIYDNVKGKPLILLLLGSEIDYEAETEEFAGLSEVYRQMNPIIRDFAEDHERIKVVDITNHIHSQEDYIDCVNHFSRQVYYSIAGEICGHINDKVEEMISKR